MVLSTSPPKGSGEFGRRELLRRGVRIAGGLAASSALHRPTVAQAMASLTQPRRRVLLLVTLYGGNDGLNTVIPYVDPLYASNRQGVAVATQSVLPLDAAWGLHPALPGLKTMWDQGRLAIVHGVGCPTPTRSHFRSMDIWQSGIPDSARSTGWVGRWLDGLPDEPLRALSVGTKLPLALVGSRVNGSTYAPGTQPLDGNRAFASVVAALGAADGDSELGRLLAASNARSGVMSGAVGDLLNASSSALRSPAPTGPLGDQLSLVARLIKAGSPTCVYSVSLGGFDVHASQRPTHQRLLGALDAALSWFNGEIAANAHGTEVVTVAYSEFGRRVAANASGGTDHGGAGPVLVCGSVIGGMYGEAPNLSRLAHGDLPVTTDFRSVYATLLDRVLGATPRPILEGSFPALGFV